MDITNKIGQLTFEYRRVFPKDLLLTLDITSDLLLNLRKNSNLRQNGKLANIMSLLPIVKIINEELESKFDLTSDFPDHKLLKLLLMIDKYGWSLDVQQHLESYVYALNPTDGLDIFRANWQKLLKDSTFQKIVNTQIIQSKADSFFSAANKISHLVGPLPNCNGIVFKRSQLYTANFLAAEINHLAFGVAYRSEGRIVTEYLFDGTLPSTLPIEQSSRFLRHEPFMEFYIRVSPPVIKAIFNEVIRQFKQIEVSTLAHESKHNVSLFAKQLQELNIDFKALSADSSDATTGYRLKMTEQNIHKLFQIYESDTMLAIIHNFSSQLRNPQGKLAFFNSPQESR